MVNTGELQKVLITMVGNLDGASMYTKSELVEDIKKLSKYYTPERDKTHKLLIEFIMFLDNHSYEYNFDPHDVLMHFKNEKYDKD